MFTKHRQIPNRIVLFIILSASFALLAEDRFVDDKLVTSYVTTITKNDARNSRGMALNEVGDILMQDRANAHKFGNPDNDEVDTYFNSVERRNEIPYMLRSGSFPEQLAGPIRQGNGYVIRVSVYRNLDGRLYISVHAKIRDQLNYDPSTMQNPNAQKNASSAANLNDLEKSQANSYQQTEMKNSNIPQIGESGEPPKKESEEAKISDALCSDIANYWNKYGSDSTKLPESLPNLLVDRLEQIVPWSKIDLSAVIKGRHPNLSLSYAVHNALIAKPVNLTTIESLLEQGKDLNLQQMPWIGTFRRIFEARMTRAITLQEEAMKLMKDGDSLTAEDRMQQAAKEYPSASLTTYSFAFSFYNKLAQDKALRAVDGNWKKISLPDKELFKDTSQQATALRSLNGKEISPSLIQMIKAYEAASILMKFSSDYEPSGDLDQPHPILALQLMRKSEKYLDLKSDETFLIKPFIDRMQNLEELIGPKATDYENIIAQAIDIEKQGKFLNAATIYRQALAIEFSKKLQQTIHRCEAKTSGL